MTDEIPRRIRAARAYAGLSRFELAERLEVSEATYKNSELGKRHVSRPELLGIAEACEVPMWFLEDGWAGSVKSVDDAAQRGVRDLKERGEDRGRASAEDKSRSSGRGG